MYGIGVVINEIREALNMTPSPEGQIVSFFATGWPIFITVVVFGIAWGIMFITVKRLVQDVVDLKKDFKEETEKMEGDIKENVLTVKKELCRKIDVLGDKVKAQNSALVVITDKSLSEKDHNLMCEPRLLRIENHVTTTVAALKDDFFKFLREIQEQDRKDKKAIETLIMANRKEVLDEFKKANDRV